MNTKARTMGNLKRIHINQHILRANRKSQKPPEPIITVKSYKANTYGFKVVIDGPSEVVYRPEKPLSCGAVLWVETRAPVIIDDRTRIP